MYSRLLKLIQRPFGGLNSPALVGKNLFQVMFLKDMWWEPCEDAFFCDSAVVIYVLDCSYFWGGNTLWVRQFMFCLATFHIYLRHFLFCL